MPPASPVAQTRNAPEETQGFLRRHFARFLPGDPFAAKLLFGAIVGSGSILILAGSCVAWNYSNQQHDRQRARAIEITRLSGAVETDIAALENAYLGHLLSAEGANLEDFDHWKDLFAKDSEDLSRVLKNEPRQAKQFLKLRNNVQTWLEKNVLSNALLSKNPSIPFAATPIAAPDLDEARIILQELQREQQGELNEQAREQDWALRSTRTLNLTAQMDRAAFEMQKAVRGFLLTGEKAFANSYQDAASDFSTVQGYLSVLVADEPGAVEQLNQIREKMQRWTVECAAPAIAARRSKRGLTSAVPPDQSDARMSEARRSIDKFEKDQTEACQRHAAAAAHELFLATVGYVLFCALAAGLVIASICYGYFVCRGQLRNLGRADIPIQTVIDQILDGMITIDAQGVVHSMNPAAKRMFGHAANEAFPTDFTSLLPTCFPLAESEPVAMEKSHLTARNGKTTLALARSRKGGETFPVELSLSEMKANENTYHVAMVRDITERKRFEEELAAEKKSLAVTLGSIGDGVITTDLHGLIVVCNPAAEALTGWPAREAIGRPFKFVFSVSVDCDLRKRRTATSGYRSEAEAILLSTPERSTLKSRDGTDRVIEQVASPMRDGKNELCGVVVVFRDVTARQRDEAESRKAETLGQLGLLAGGIAHDFNNLLTAIIGNISLAASNLAPEDPMVVRLEDARNASHRARDLAQQLLTFARGGAPMKKNASIAKLVEETVSFSLRGSHSRSELAVDRDLWPAEFDPGHISQVIANLVVNGDQAMPDGGTLHVSCSNFSNNNDATPAVPDLASGEFIRIQVRDEGVGVPAKYLQQIFDPYFTTKPKGSGLGLATSYSIVKNHSGLITVESELSHGATFTVYLPAARHLEPVTEPVAPKVEPLSADGTGRVLVVDDEEAIRDLVDFTLARLGYEVVTAETALRGIEIYREALGRGRRFDLVILDLTLPGGMGGKEALKRLIEIDPMVNAVVSSGYAMDATMSRSEDFGFRGVIAKPYEAAELGRIVREVIESSRVAYGDACQLQHA